MTQARPWMIEGTAVVTGAGRGNGAAIARRLGERGAHVVLADIDAESAEASAAALRQEGLSATSREVDVCSEVSVDELAVVAAGLGRLVAWVNNAGIIQRVPLQELTVEDWDRMMTVNARSVFLGTRAAARLMESGAAIVNVASISSFIALPNTSHYGASKGAIVAFTKHAALELGPRGIRINAIAPGTIRTAMTEARLADRGQLEATLSRIPLGRVGEPEDVAGAAAFLCSNEAAFINGAVLMCDGGWTAA